MLAQIPRLLPLLCALALGPALNADNSKRVELYYGIAEGNYLIGDLQGASQGIAQVLKLEPNYLPALKLQTRLQLKQGETQAALDSIQAALKLDPDNLELQVLEAQIQSDSEQPLTAINQVLSVYTNRHDLGALKQQTRLRIMRAQTLALSGELEAAIRELQQLINQQPENLEATITLASLYAGAERWNSLEALIPALAAQPEMQDIALYFEGRTLFARKRMGSAREKFTEALALPGNSQLKASLHFYRGACLLSLEKHALGQAEILTAINAQFSPETPQEILLASRCLIQDQQAERAIQLLEPLTLHLGAESSTAWSLLGRAHQLSGTHTLAVSAFNESLRIDPDQAEVRAQRGNALRKLGDLNGAIADYQAAQMLDPGNHGYPYALGLAQLQLGQIPAAEQNIGLASRLLPENSGLALLHALLAHATHAPRTAQKALQHYLQNTTEKANESAYYLEYILQNENALETLKQRTTQTDCSQALTHFSAYCHGEIQRKVALDFAGKASSPNLAQQQITEAAYWMAQAAFKRLQPSDANELLRICIDVGKPDQLEYQLARWQLRQDQP
ncbi:MAG: tetratricopeptide (TPR) repeat protein [Lentimonas sp.]|jgi:tetratricopeptide (TPR) repeat protein